MEGVCREGLQELGWNLDDIIPEEADAGLGNGGLGRLAACFIDSLAALKLPGHGCSIRYQYGLFDQRIVDGQQVELPDVWLRKGFPWEVQRLDKAVNVRFGGDAYMEAQPDGSLKCQHKNYMNVRAVPYDVPILGYRNDTVNTLRLWKAEYTREDISRQLQFGDVRHAMRYKDSIQMISRYLYPEDSTWEGRKLRLMQEYFFVSAGVQSIVKYYKKKYGDIRKFDQSIAMHINDTHPALIIPELMRILLDEEGLTWEEAWQITVQSVAYTNHTVMPEAMERWPIPMFKELLPRIYLVVEEIHNQWQKRVRERWSQLPDVRRDEVRDWFLSHLGNYRNITDAARLILHGGVLALSLYVLGYLGLAWLDMAGSFYRPEVRAGAIASQWVIEPIQAVSRMLSRSAVSSTRRPSAMRLLYNSNSRPTTASM